MSKLGGPRRKRALALVFVLAMVAVALPLAAPALATHGTCVLDLTPETDTNNLGEQHTITATLRPAGTDPNGTSTASCTTREGGRIDVSFEVTGDNGATYSPGAIDAASTPASPDLACSMNPNSDTCTVTYTRTAVAGTDTVVGFFTAHGTTGPSDSVTKTWVAPAATRLDCTPETDSNPTGTAHVITCTATNNAGQTVNAINVDVEVTGTGDPDSADSPTSPDLTCTTAGAGTCTVSHTSNTVGDSAYRAWIDSDNNNGTFNGDATEGQAEATAPGATAEPDATDVLAKTWVAATTTRLDCTPETDSNPTGTAHAITCTATNNTGQTVNAVNVDVEVTGTGDPDGADSPTSPDLTCTTAGNGTCTVSHTSNNVGSSSYRAWIDSDNNNSTFNGDATEGQAEATAPGATAEPDATDVVAKTWTATPTTATRVDCNPETATNPTGTAHAITCTATNSSNQTVAGAQIDVEAAGTNDPDNGDSNATPDFTCVTNNQGTCTVTHGTGGIGTTPNAGTTTYRAWIDVDQNNATGGPDTAEGQAEVTQPGTTAEPDATDVVTKTWTSGPTNLSITPTSDTAQVGECNPFTVTVTDSGNRGVSGVTVDVEQLHALATNNVANDEPTVSFCTPATGANISAVDEARGDLRENPDNRGSAGGETTTATNAAGQVTFGIAVSPAGGSDGTGTVTVSAFAETTDNDDPEQGEPRATATKTWTAPPPPPTCPGFESDPRNQVVGTEGDDVLEGTAGADIICGLGGDDLISGLAGNDLLIGGGGHDRISGGDGDDVARGGAGSDVLTGNAGADVLRGGVGSDVLMGGADDDRIFGGGGDDILHGNAGRDVLRGGPGNDVLRGGRGPDRCGGGRGTDTKRGC